MAAEPIQIDNDGWHLHAEMDAVGAKLILRKYTSGTDYTEHGEYRTLPEAASGYLDVKYGMSIQSSVGATLATVLAGKKAMLASLKSGFPGGEVKVARIILKGEA